MKHVCMQTLGYGFSLEDECFRKMLSLRIKCSLILFLSSVCSVRVIGESDVMQEFLSESDEVSQIYISIYVSASSHLHLWLVHPERLAQVQYR